MDTTCAKCACRCRHVKSPRSVRGIVRCLSRLLCVLFQAFNPTVESQSIVLTKALNVFEHPIRPFQPVGRLVQRNQLSVWKDNICR